MKRVWIAAVVLALGASPLWAQRPERGRGAAAMQVMLLGQKSVQDELKLSDEQREKVDAFVAKARKEREGARNLSEEERAQKAKELQEEAHKLVKDTLKEDQAKRLHQIALQQAGALAFADPEVAKKLDLTDEQKGKIRTIGEEAFKEMRGLFQPGGNREEGAKKMAELRKKTHEQVMEVLTKDQKDKWKEMTGEPFKGEIRFGPPGGGRRRGEQKQQ